MATKANGDPLEGSIAVPTNYPNPTDNNVNMHSLSWAYGRGNATIDFTAPSAPSSLTSPAKTTTTVDLSWTASTDDNAVVGYDVYQASTLVMSVTGTTATVTGLTTGTAYSFTVKARDHAGNRSAASNTLAVTTN